MLSETIDAMRYSWTTMLRLLHSLLLVGTLLLCLPGPTLGEEGPACNSALTLRIGDVVPCSEGVLWPPDWALEAVRVKTIMLPRCEADLELERAERLIDVQDLRAKLVLCKEAFEEQRELFDAAMQLPQATKPPFYKTPLFWGVVGVTVGGLAAWGITYGVMR